MAGKGKQLFGGAFVVMRCCRRVRCVCGAGASKGKGKAAKGGADCA